MGRPRSRCREEDRDRYHQPQGGEPVREPWPPLRAGQGGHVQRLRMGQLLPRPGDRRQKPPARPTRHRRLCGAGGATGFAGLYGAAARQPDHRRALLFRHALHRAASAGRFPATRHDQAVPGTQRLALPPRFDAEGRGRGDDPDRAPHHAGRKKGCRPICSAFFHGTEVASDRVDAETYAAFNRAVREAVRRINANKRAYLHYFIDYHAKNDPEIAALTIDDLRESRVVVCDPAPIPLDEMQRTFDWLKSWGMLEATASPFDLVNLAVQREAHFRTAAARP